MWFKETGPLRTSSISGRSALHLLTTRLKGNQAALDCIHSGHKTFSTIAALRQASWQDRDKLGGGEQMRLCKSQELKTIHGARTSPRMSLSMSTRVTWRARQRQSREGEVSEPPRDTQKLGTWGLWLCLSHLRTKISLTLGANPTADFLGVHQHSLVVWLGHYHRTVNTRGYFFVF